ncbi:MAG TPA: hypothetical protein VFZ44_05660 [Pyrinomonadaceae bacterium]
MDDEQFERHKEFMLRHQAESAARLAQLEELIVLFEQETRDRLEDGHDGRDGGEG